MFASLPPSEVVAGSRRCHMPICKEDNPGTAKDEEVKRACDGGRRIELEMEGRGEINEIKKRQAVSLG
ncbi:unnamed protein product [Linum trigynum]|uniref:Uncharacterized protein n=1 Tax=Linum trigynum TaxID=586398 RepID=A0AAV2CXA9_9ROSI